MYSDFSPVHLDSIVAPAGITGSFAIPQNLCIANGTLDALTPILALPRGIGKVVVHTSMNAGLSIFRRASGESVRAGPGRGLGFQRGRDFEAAIAPRREIVHRQDRVERQCTIDVRKQACPALEVFIADLGFDAVGVNR